MARKTYKLLICGKSWKYRKRTPESFSKLYENDEAVAITKIDTRAMEFMEYDLETIRHELFHAYVSELHIESADLSRNQYEEILAEMLSKNWELMDKQARTMSRNLRKRI